MSGLRHWEESFASVGWFIPPYMQMGRIGALAATIHGAAGTFSQDSLEKELTRFYEPIGLASMVLHRYPVVPVIQDYQTTISEAVEAHFAGLHNVAVAGLAPVIEGAGRRLGQQRGIEQKHIKDVFLKLTEACKADQLGATDEVDSMMDSFLGFARTAFFENSNSYPFGDGTNRHGIAHGAFADADYGRPLNFYKTIAAVDFLTFAASFKANVSWFAPNPTEASIRRAAYYLSLAAQDHRRANYDRLPADQMPAAMAGLMRRNAKAAD